MAPILGRYGPFLLYTYAVVLGAGDILQVGDGVAAAGLPGSRHADGQ